MPEPEPLRIRYLNPNAIRASPVPIDQKFAQVVREFVEVHDSKRDFAQRAAFMWAYNWTRPEDTEALSQTEVARAFSRLHWRQHYRRNSAKILDARKRRQHREQPNV